MQLLTYLGFRPIRELNLDSKSDFPNKFFYSMLTSNGLKYVNEYYRKFNNLCLNLFLRG